MKNVAYYDYTYFDYTKHTYTCICETRSVALSSPSKVHGHHLVERLVEHLLRLHPRIPRLLNHRRARRRVHRRVHVRVDARVARDSLVDEDDGLGEVPPLRIGEALDLPVVDERQLTMVGDRNEGGRRVLKGVRLLYAVRIMSYLSMSMFNVLRVECFAIVLAKYYNEYSNSKK